MSFWAVIYHPMEATSGHLIGFLYMFLLLVQGSLFFTRAHVNRWWTLFLEVAVLAHGTLVAIYAPLGWERLTEVARIPMIDYAAVFALAGLIGGALGLIRLIRPATASARTPSAPSGVMPEAVVLTEDLRRRGPDGGGGNRTRVLKGTAQASTGLSGDSLSMWTRDRRRPRLIQAR